MKRIIAAALAALLLASCNKKEEPANDELPDAKYCIFKLKGDYINNVSVLYSYPKQKIIEYQCPMEPPYTNPAPNGLFKMADGYYLKRSRWCDNELYLTTTKAEYVQTGKCLDKEAAESLIIDKYPYLEYYVDENRILEKNPTPYKLEVDTALLSSIIKNKELEAKFKRLR